MRLGDAGTEIELLEQVVELAKPDWQEHRISVAEFAYRKVELCVAAEELGAPDAETEHFAYWAQPLIVPGGGQLAAEDEARATRDLTAEELDARRQHLEALGYIN